jgi:hypothetical protein
VEARVVLTEAAPAEESWVKKALQLLLLEARGFGSLSKRKVIAALTRSKSSRSLERPSQG